MKIKIQKPEVEKKLFKDLKAGDVFILDNDEEMDEIFMALDSNTEVLELTSMSNHSIKCLGVGENDYVIIFESELIVKM